MFGVNNSKDHLKWLTFSLVVHLVRIYRVTLVHTLAICRQSFVFFVIVPICIWISLALSFILFFFSIAFFPFRFYVSFQLKINSVFDICHIDWTDMFVYTICMYKNNLSRSHTIDSFWTNDSYMWCANVNSSTIGGDTTKRYVHGWWIFIYRLWCEFIKCWWAFVCAICIFKNRIHDI